MTFAKSVRRADVSSNISFSFSFLWISGFLSIHNLLLDYFFNASCRIPEIVEECSSWFHWRREDWWVPEEARNFLDARNGTKESGQCHRLSNLTFLFALNFKISNISSMFYVTILILTFYLTAFLCFISYLSRKGKSRPGKESDTSRHTTTTWRASWRITQMAFLWRSESSLRLAVTDEQSVNTKRLEMQSGILLWHKGSSPTAWNMLDCYWKAASCATTWVPFLLLRRSVVQC